MKAGNVAIQQALRYVFNLPYRTIGTIMGINHRTAWQHIQARDGSNVAAWENRPKQIQNEAIELAKKEIKAFESICPVCSGSGEEPFLPPFTAEVNGEPCTVTVCTGCDGMGVISTHTSA